MFTRNQYLNDECTHEEYYGQFVSNVILDRVTRHFEAGELSAAYAKDDAFNTIPLHQWDSLAQFALWGTKTPERMKEAGDSLTMAGMVCIVKEAARQAVERESK